jgi:hypothetical protein
MPFGSNALIAAPSLEKDAQFADTYAGGPYTLGQIVTGFDPAWGFMELVLAKFATASTLVEPGRLVTLSSAFLLADNANTANTARPVYVVAQRFPSDAGVGSSTPLYGWVARSAGLFPVQASAAFTAGPAYFAAAGNITSTLTAGKQVVGMNGITGSTGTDTRQAFTLTGSKIVKVSSKRGLFVGGTVSGTGIPASTEIESLDTGSNNEIKVNNDCTATGSITMTQTYTGFALCQFSCPSTQGNIT